LEIVAFYEETFQEWKEKLERKEYFMQHKEKKWTEVEHMIRDFVKGDKDL
jgi:hypothetical protein